MSRGDGGDGDGEELKDELVWKFFAKHRSMRHQVSSMALKATTAQSSTAPRGINTRSNDAAGPAAAWPAAAWPARPAAAGSGGSHAANWV